LIGVRRFDDRRAMENIQQSRATRLGRHYPNREHLLRVQGRGPDGLCSGRASIHNSQFDELLASPLLAVLLFGLLRMRVTN